MLHDPGFDTPILGHGFLRLKKLLWEEIDVCLQLCLWGMPSQTPSKTPEQGRNFRSLSPATILPYPHRFPGCSERWKFSIQYGCASLVINWNVSTALCGVCKESSRWGKAAWVVAIWFTYPVTSPRSFLSLVTSSRRALSVPSASAASLGKTAHGRQY